MIRRPRSLVYWVLLAALAAALHGFADDKAKDKEPSKDLDIERMETVYRYQNDGTGSITQSSRIRVLTEAGRDAIGQFYFSYSSGLEDLRIDYFRTDKKDGTQLPVDPAQAVETASPISQSAPMFSDVKVKVLVARDLAVGDALEYQFARVVRVPLKPGDFWAMHFQDQGSVVDSEVVTLDVPEDRRLTLKASADSHYTTEHKDGRTVYRWELSNPKPREASDLPQDPLFVASTLTDWKQVGDWYRGLEAGRVEATPEIKALAAQLTAGKNTPRERLEALYAYASEQVRYVALEFGIGGYQPHAAADVLRNRYGDCKDKSGLLEALLAAAGITAYPALLNAERGVIEPAVPMPGQFDHVITVVPMDGQLLWMDPTLGVAPLGVLAGPERGKQALVVEPGASRVADIPEKSPVPETETLDATGKLDAAGKLTLDDRLELRGLGEVVFRTLFRLGNQDALNSVAKRLAEMQAPGATAGDPKPSDPLDLSKPFRLDLPVTDSDFFPALEKSHDVRMPLLTAETGALALEIERARKQVEQAAKKPGGHKPQDIDLLPGGSMHYNADVEIDPAYQVDLPLPVHVDRPFASYDSTYTFEHGHLKAQRALVLKMDKLPAADWQDLEVFRRLVETDSAQTLQLRRASPLSLESKLSDLSAEDAEQQGMKAIEQNDFFTAQKLFAQATKKDPESKTAWNNLGRADSALGLLDPAEAALKTQIKVHPDDEYAYNNLGRIYAARHEYDRAIEQYRKQLEINPLDPYTYPNLAAAYESMERWDDAAQAWAKQVAIDHTQWASYASWGYALLKAGKLDDGREKMKRALDMDRSPEALNDISYQMAEAGVDLDQAAQYARSAVGQALAGISDADSLDVPKDYNTRLGSLSAFLDTLGWVYFRQKHFSEAEPLIAAAHDLRAQSDVAEHLARVYASEDRPEDALRYYAWSGLEAGWTGQTAPELSEYLEAHYGGPDGLMRKAAAVDKGYFSQHRLAPAASSAWPAGAALSKSVVVQLQALVDEKGSVRDLEAASGDEPFRSAALKDARGLTLPVFSATGQPVKTVRSITYVYSPPQQVTAVWNYGKADDRALQAFNMSEGSVFAPGMMLISTGQMDQGIAALREALRTQPDSPYAEQAHLAIAEGLSAKRDYEGSAAEYRAAAQSSPDDPRPHRMLADALAMKGDHAAALAEYQRAVELNPSDAEGHFSLGAQLEAAAAGEALKGYHFDPRTGRTGPAATKLSKSALDNYHAACEQYRLAHQLIPDMPAYAEAYQRLVKQLGEKP
jgi:tetratricopeptide (TPR) repeat protein/transglutaminase-like putative cysteine protease